MSTNLALNNNWLDASATLTNASNQAVFANASYNLNTGWCYRDYWYPWYRPIEYHHTTVVEKDVRPIKLTMSEVERLRVAAKKDKDIKAILAKFTDLIEVTVDF